MVVTLSFILHIFCYNKKATCQESWCWVSGTLCPPRCHLLPCRPFSGVTVIPQLLKIKKGRHRIKRILRAFCSDFVLRYSKSCLRRGILLLVWKVYKWWWNLGLEGNQEVTTSSPPAEVTILPLPADTVSLKLPEVDDNLSSYEKDLFIFHFNFKHFTDMRLLFIDNLKQSLRPEEIQSAHVTTPWLGHHGAQKRTVISEWGHVLTPHGPGEGLVHPEHYLRPYSDPADWGGLQATILQYRAQMRCEDQESPPGRLLPRRGIPFPLWLHPGIVFRLFSPLWTLLHEP